MLRWPESWSRTTVLCPKSAPQPAGFTFYGCSVALVTRRCSKWAVASEMHNTLARLNGLSAVIMRTPDQRHDLKGSGFRPRCLPVQEIMMKCVHFFTIPRTTQCDYLLQTAITSRIFGAIKPLNHSLGKILEQSATELWHLSLKS